jgi:hypothetical protein
MAPPAAEREIGAGALAEHAVEEPPKPKESAP